MSGIAVANQVSEEIIGINCISRVKVIKLIEKMSSTTDLKNE